MRNWDIACAVAPLHVVGHSPVVLNNFWYSPPVKLASCSWSDADIKAGKFGGSGGLGLLAGAFSSGFSLRWDG
jgi:hypothetical protein